MQKAKEREERGALAPQSADVMALADHLGDNKMFLLVLITKKSRIILRAINIK